MKPHGDQDAVEESVDPGAERAHSGDPSSELRESAKNDRPRKEQQDRSQYG